VGQRFVAQALGKSTSIKIARASGIQISAGESNITKPTSTPERNASA